MTIRLIKSFGFFLDLPCFKDIVNAYPVYLNDRNSVPAILGANQIVARKWWVETSTTASAPVGVSTDRNVSDNLKYTPPYYRAHDKTERSELSEAKPRSALRSKSAKQKTRLSEEHSDVGICVFCLSDSLSFILWK